MDILIKSFNRPYYLDRCLQSIYANVQDVTLFIKVLDDGTPSRYLEKIQLKYPDVVIYKSAFYNEKSKSINENQEIKSKNIPIDLWLNAAKDATDYFLLMEDDFWFTKTINLENTQKILKEDNINLLKLIWLNNPKLIRGETLKIRDNITIYQPKFFTSKPLQHRLIFGTTRYYLKEIMGFCGLYSKDKALHYYSIYGVAGAVFKKDYFINLWKKHENQVDENLQLKNAVKYLHQNPNIQFARTNKELVATGFLSSAANKDFVVGDFDIFVFNKIINEAWLSDKFDVKNDFSQDLDISKIESILSQESNSRATIKDWKKWSFLFKNQFQKIGCNI